ncbi:MAG: hypothetical protein V2G45_08535 [bacterium JZ-2024 1]
MEIALGTGEFLIARGLYRLQAWAGIVGTIFAGMSLVKTGRNNGGAGSTLFPCAG